MKRKTKWLIGLSVALVLGVFAAIAVYLIIILAGEKLLKENIGKLTMDQATIIYDSEGKEVTSVYRQNRELVKYEDLPKDLIKAFIAVEDKRFFEHTGFDVRAVMRALYRDLIQRQAKEGGSTITQQLAKNMFLNSDKTLFRKLRELSLALALENNYSKDQIIEMYLNNIYFGNGAYGVKTASELFFDKSDLNQLEIWEMATLAAIPKAPTQYSPLNDAEKSKMRRAVVLKLMFDQGFITEDQRTVAAAVQYNVKTSTAKRKTAYLTYIDYVIDEVEQVYGISEQELLRSGYKIFTAMDRRAQRAIEDVYADASQFPKNGPKQMAQSAMVIIDHKTGGLAAMIGGRDYVNKGLNRALVRRQPGSSFKPIVSFAPALEAGRNPYTPIVDKPMSFGNNTYSPKNYDNKYRGSVNMFEAMRLSINIPAVALLDEYGVKKGFEMAKNLDIELSPDDKNLSIALGGLTYGVTPLEMARAYGTFANYGELVETHSVKRIVDANGNDVNPDLSDQKRTLKTKRVMSGETAYILTQLLQGVVDGGTGKAAKMKWPVAGKTGTTQSNLKGVSGGNRDAWFVGYTSEYTAAVWLGFDKTDKNHYLLEGSSLTAKIFKNVMTRVMRDKEVRPFAPGAGGYELEKYKKPEAVVTLNGEMTPERFVRLEWSSNEEGLSYRVYRKDEASSDFSIVHETSDTSFVDMEVQPSASYEYYVEVIRPETGITGNQSNTFMLTTPSEYDPLPGEEGEEPLPLDELPEPLPDETVDPDVQTDSSEGDTTDQTNP
jgi:penicillin-binding protein 2A